jgi:soluble lytic murein transglycosylase-like protein
MRVLAGLLFTCAAFAGEFAVLSTGFELKIDRHEHLGDTVRLYANGGVTEIPAALVVEFVTAASPRREAAAAPAAQPTAKELVNRAAERWGLPAGLVHSVVRAESGYQQTAVSPKGAIGVMQLMPGTARELGADPHDPEQNVDAGTRYLRELLLKYQDDDHQLRKAVAAYNAGPGAVDKYRGVPPYRETMQYVERVLKQYRPEQ